MREITLVRLMEEVKENAYINTANDAMNFIKTCKGYVTSNDALLVSIITDMGLVTK